MRAGTACVIGLIAQNRASVSETVSPAKSCSPVSISYSTTPKAQMSARLSTAFPRACSGDMYAAVPRITPCMVAAPLIVGELAMILARAVVRECFRQAEIQHFDFSFRRNFHVGGF